MSFIQLLPPLLMTGISLASDIPSQTSSLTNFGLDVAPSCPNGITKAGYYIDRSYDSQCFPRKVHCDAQGNANITDTLICGNGYTFISDCDPTCHDPTSAAARSACGISIDCGLNGITVTVTDGAVFHQTDSDIQFGNQLNPGSSCRIPHNCTTGYYQGTYNFTNSENCGFSPRLNPDNGDGFNIQFNFVLMRYAQRKSFVTDSSSQRRESQDLVHNVVVTREKCFMVNAQCNYNIDGTATGSYEPSSPHTLEKLDTNNLQFQMVPADCTTGATIPVQDVTVCVDICFKNIITTDWHANIRISTTSCWATPSSDPNDVDKYRLFAQLPDTAYVETSFEWGCTANVARNYPYEEVFQFESFRFQNLTYNNMNIQESYAQTMHIHCEVNACDSTDETSEDCVQHCPDGQGPGQVRMRRNAQSSAMLPLVTNTLIGSKVFVLFEEMKYDTHDYSFHSGGYILGIFTVGCVFGVVAIGMLVAMMQQKKQLEYQLITNV